VRALISFWYRIAKIRSGSKKVQDCWSLLNASQAARNSFAGRMFVTPDLEQSNNQAHWEYCRKRLYLNCDAFSQNLNSTAKHWIHPKNIFMVTGSFFGCIRPWAIFQVDKFRKGNQLKWEKSKTGPYFIELALIYAWFFKNHEKLAVSRFSQHKKWRHNHKVFCTLVSFITIKKVPLGRVSPESIVALRLREWPESYHYCQLWRWA